MSLSASARAGRFDLCSSHTQSSPEVWGYNVVLVGLNPHSCLSKVQLFTSKWFPGVRLHAWVLGGLVVWPFSLLTHSKLFLPCSAMSPNAHPKTSVGSRQPPALAWKLHHCEGIDVSLIKLRINYLWWNLALAVVTKASTLRAKWSLWSPSLAHSSRLLLL